MTSGTQAESARIAAGDRARFALIGAAGYIAPRHLDAIKHVGGTLAAAYDPSDSVGIVDRYFPEAKFFVAFELFADHVERLRGTREGIRYVSICSPNYLHKAHAGFALRCGADAICEKPLVLEPRDVDDLEELQAATGRRVNTILQLRLHPAIVALRDKIQADRSGRVWDVDLNYVTARGAWYHASWKGDEAKSGGIATNIGVHFYDVLGFVFGRPSLNVVHHRAADCAAGYLEFDRARVRWFLSINRQHMTANDGPAQRCMEVRDVGFFDFSKGFENLHNASYERIVAGDGFSVAEARAAIEIVSHIRKAPIEPNRGRQHPMLSSVR